MCQFCPFGCSCIFSFAKNNLIRYVGRLHLHMSTQAHSLTHIGTEAHRLTDTWYRHHPSTVRARFRFVFYEMVFVRSHYGSSSQLLGFHTRFHSWTGFTHGFIVYMWAKGQLDTKPHRCPVCNNKMVWKVLVYTHFDRDVKLLIREHIDGTLCALPIRTRHDQTVTPVVSPWPEEVAPSEEVAWLGRQSK